MTLNENEGLDIATYYPDAKALHDDLKENPVIEGESIMLFAGDGSDFERVPATAPLFSHVRPQGVLRRLFGGVDE